MASIQKRPDGKWRARYRDAAGKEHARHFTRKVDAQRWLDETTASIVTGQYVDPATAKTTVAEWVERWLATYATRKPSTVRQAKVHTAKIVEEFGDRRLDALRPSDVKGWLVKLQGAGYAPSYVYAVHNRLGQLYRDAMLDGLVGRSPVSRRTTPPTPKQRPYVATTAQVWAIHDAVDEIYRPAVLLAAFAGLRVAEVGGLRVEDVDLMRGVIHPTQQYPAEPLKTDMSRTPVPVPNELALMLAASMRQGSPWVVANVFGEQVAPHQIQREMRRVFMVVPGLPPGFRFHDLRHYYASLLIASGADVKVVQARLRHASATTTLNTYAHLWPDSEDATRAAISSVMTARADSLRTRGGPVGRNA